MKFIKMIGLFVMAFTMALNTNAQYDVKTSAASKAYNKFKTFNNKQGTINAKVQKLVAADVKKRAKQTMDDDRGIAQKDFDKLSTAELLAYCATYGESFNQICDVDLPIVDEEKKILPYLTQAYDEYGLSTRQMDALKANKKAICNLIMAAAKKEKRLGVNFKNILYSIMGTDAIPEIISFYKASTKKDTDILTLLNLFMLDLKYEPFLSSQTNQKLYVENEVPSYERFISFNKSNEELILTRAAEFYASL